MVAADDNLARSPDLVPGSGILMPTLAEQLAAAVSEQERIVKDFRHRIKNTLAVIQSLISLENEGITDEKTLASMRRIQSRIQASSMLYDVLRRSDGRMVVDMAAYLGEMAKSLAREAGAEGIELFLDLETLILSASQASALGLAANEAIENALKHGFPAGRGRLALRLARVGPRVEFSVSDSGPGFPVGFDPMVDGGLGLKLMSIEAAELRGSLKLGSEGEAAITIDFPQQPID